ncbi:uncharacterized protein ACIBXB_003845 [Morphnus guianensis]
MLLSMIPTPDLYQPKRNYRHIPSHQSGWQAVTTQGSGCLFFSWCLKRSLCRLCHPGHHLEGGRGAGSKRRSWHLGQPHTPCLSISCCSSKKGKTTSGRRGLAHGLLGTRSRVGPRTPGRVLEHLESSGVKFRAAPCLFVCLVSAQEPGCRSAGGPEPPRSAADEGKGAGAIHAACVLPEHQIFSQKGMLWRHALGSHVNRSLLISSQSLTCTGQELFPGPEAQANPHLLNEALLACPQAE